MNMEDARKIERPPIVVGQQYTVLLHNAAGVRAVSRSGMRNYTGKLVTRSL